MDFFLAAIVQISLESQRNGVRLHRGEQNLQELAREKKPNQAKLGNEKRTTFLEIRHRFLPQICERDESVQEGYISYSFPPCPFCLLKTTEPGASHILTNFLPYHCYDPALADGETEAQMDWVACTRLQRKPVAEAAPHHPSGVLPSKIRSRY